MIGGFLFKKLILKVVYLDSMLIKRINITCFLLLFSSFLFSQDPSLINVYNDAAKRCQEEGIDSVEFYNKRSLEISAKLRLPNFDGKYLETYLLIRAKKYSDALPNIKRLLYMANEANNQKQLGKANYLYALLYEEQNDVNNSLKFAKLALQIREKTKDTSQILSSVAQLGRIYKKNNKLTEGLTYYLRSARLAEQIGDSSHIYSSYINLGTLYQKTADNKKALEFYNKALEINKRDNDTNGYAICYLKLSSAWSAENNLDSAYYYINKCVELQRIQNNDAGLMSSLNKLAGVLAEKGETTLAIKNFDEVIKIAEKRQDALSLIWGLTGKAKTLYKMKKYKEALPLANRAMLLDKEKTDYSFISLTYKLISDINFEMGDYKEAYKNHVLYKMALDTLLARNDIKKQTELKLSYEFDQIQELQKEEALSKEIKNELQLEAAKKQRYFLIAFLGLALLIVVIAVRSYINKRKSNFLLEKKNAQLDHQKQLVEEKNKEISDSINYAKHIQTACLPDKQQLDASFEDYYILFKPRDVVSGDFFWTEKKQDFVFIGVADCTGHGVPGAIMSMIGSILLNEIFYVKKIYSPDKILQELNRVVKTTLKQQGSSSSRDGMDIAFCAWDKKNGSLLYSGANRSLIIISENGKLEEYKPTKQPIGGTTELNQKYDLVNIPLTQGDRIIFTTDGFADQFGGRKLKKINSKKLKEKFVELVNYPSSEQQEKLNYYFEEWKGVLEQTDDVLVFSFKV